jgi:hypothetical protein
MTTAMLRVSAILINLWRQLPSFCCRSDRFSLPRYSPLKCEIMMSMVGVVAACYEDVLQHLLRV